MREDGGVIWGERGGEMGRGGGRGCGHFWARLGGMRNRSFGEMFFLIAYYLNKLELISFAGKRLMEIKLIYVEGRRSRYH